MPERIWKFGPLRYALPARAVADAVRDMTSLRDVRAVVADAVQRDHCEVRQLSAELGAGPNIGSALFREALSDVADGIRSAAEGDLKDLLGKSGLPMPLFNPKVFAGDRFVAQPDAWWPEFGVAVEVDSREWHMSPEDHAKTLARGRRMGVHLIIALRFTPKQIRSEPAEVVADIRRALEGARGRPPLNLRTIPTAPDRNDAALSRLYRPVVTCRLVPGARSSTLNARDLHRHLKCHLIPGDTKRVALTLGHCFLSPIRPARRAMRRQRSARRSARICPTTLRPGMPVTPPPPWVAEPA